MNAKEVRYLAKHTSTQSGKSFLITGSNSGIGLEMAKAILYLGGHVTFMVRTEKKALDAIAAIEADLGKKASYDIALYEQSDPVSIKNCVASLKIEEYEAVIFNAGVYFPKKGSLCENGVPLTLQTNATGTQVCFDELFKRYPNAKYVFTTSIVNSSPKKHDYAPYFADSAKNRSTEYAISKRIVMNIFVNALKAGAKAYMTHPGVSKTNIIRDFAPVIKKLGNGFLYLFTHPAWKAGMGAVLLACSDYPNGTYLVPRGLFEISGYPRARKVPKKASRDAESWQKYHQNNNS